MMGRRKPTADAGGRAARRYLRALCVILVAGVACGVGHAQSADQAARPPAPRAASDLAGLRARIAAALSALTHARGEMDRLQDDVNAAEQKLAQAHEQLAQVQVQRTSVEAQLQDTATQATALQKQLDQQRRILAEQLRAEYRLGANDPLQALLSGTDPGVVGRLFADYAYLYRARAETMAAMHERMAALATLRAQQNAEREQLVAAQREQEAALARLQQLKQSRADAVATMRAKMDRQGAELAALRDAEKRMQDILEQAQRQAAAQRARARAERQAQRQAQRQQAPGRSPAPAGGAGPTDFSGLQGPFPTLRGHLLRPVSGPLLARFGAPRAGGPLTWKGTWIGAPRGTPVRASARGRVVHVGWVSSYGLIVLVDHGHGYFTLYGHADHASVRVGEDVAAGQVIATAGDTGGYDRSGVYFEIRHNGRPLDPRAWFAR